MQKLSKCQPETDGAPCAARKTSTFVKLAEAGARRALRIVLPPLPQRELSLTDRKSRAAQRMVEFVLWQASGGDFLLSSRADEFRQLAPRH